jgi:hypothetical protein
MSIMNSAGAMNKDGYFFENAQREWQYARDAWRGYGERELPTSVGFNIRLNDKERAQEQIDKDRAELAKLCPGIEEEIRKEKIARLSADKRAVLDVPPADRSGDQHSLAYDAEQEIKVEPKDFLGRAPRREDRPRVRELVDRIEENEKTRHQIDLNRRIVNFEYWRTRAESELTPEAPQAHSNVYEADKLQHSGENLVKAREMYETAWKLYATIFDKYPDLMENAEAQDLIESVAHYRDLLGQLDEPFPSSFPLWNLLDKHYKGQQIRDQVKLLQGNDAAGGKDEKQDEKKSDESDKPADPNAEKK